MFFPFRDENPTRRPAIVNWTLIAVNFLALVWMTLLDSPAEQALVFDRGFIPVRISQLADRRPLLINAPQVAQHPQLPILVRDDRTYRFEPVPAQIVASMFTSMFLHAGWMHLLSNMWFLWLFGNNVEDRLGHVVYLVFYLLGGLAALACHWLTNPASPVPVIGASGAVAAVLGAYAITFPFAQIRTLVFLFIFVTIVDLPALLVLGVWFLGQLLEARAALHLNVDGGVAFAAHVGGFIAGLILMPLAGGTRVPPDEVGHRVIDVDSYESPWPP
ncbi:MAG: rhomboid family intramembrane serine protease [Planctomycetes bacterium]|nr:rhomboid family intramembrane serine protease [Planctomycetota bacterium]